MNEAFVVVCDSRDREKWLAARQEGVGASEAAAVLGISPWDSRLSLAARKAGAMEPIEDNEFMAAGRRLEPFIAEWALEENEINRRGMPCGLMLRSIAMPWLFCTPDWWVEEEYEGEKIRVPLQVKNTMRASDWDDGVPDPIMIQCQTEQIVTGSPWSYAAALLTGNRLRWVRVDPNPDLHESIITNTKKFWDDLSAGKIIDPDASKASTDALRALYPQDNGETIALDGEYLEIALEMDGLKRERKEIDEIINLGENRIKAAMGDATFATFPDGSGYTNKTQTRKEYVVKETSFRVLRRKDAK